MVIPAILAKSQKELKEKLDLILAYADFIQVDIMDGKFVPNKTWGDPKALAELSSVIDYEVHLMVEHPERVIEKWAKAGASRIIFHFEATKNPEKCILEIKKYKKEVGLAINPETPVEKIKKLLPLPPRLHPGIATGDIRDPKVDYVLVMGVNPGFSGQKFQPVVLEKIKQIKKIAPQIQIGVDGGVDKANAKKLYAAGVDNLTAASAIFKSKNIRKAMEELNSA